MTTQYQVNKAVYGVDGFGLPFTADNYTVTLGATTEATVTVPSSSAMGAVNSSNRPEFIAIFSYEAAKNVYVALNATAAVPAGATLAASASQLNPPGRFVYAGDVIHMICADASTDVSVSFYAIQG